MIQVTTSYGPTHHRTHVLEYPACGDGSRRFAINDPGYVSTVKFSEWDVTYYRKHIFTEPAFNLLG